MHPTTNTFRLRVAQALIDLAPSDPVFDLLSAAIISKGGDPTSRTAVGAALEQVFGANGSGEMPPVLRTGGPDNSALQKLIFSILDEAPYFLGGDLYETVLAEHKVPIRTDAELQQAIRAALVHYASLPETDHPL